LQEGEFWREQQEDMIEANEDFELEGHSTEKDEDYHLSMMPT